MSPERWEQITEIYNSAQELEENEQESFLEKACADDESLLYEVKSLLTADGNAGSFIAENAVKDSPSLLTLENFTTLSGQTLGQFQIISHIGSGGMGEVYLAKDLRLNRHVALKALPISSSGNRIYLLRFQTEAKAAATLNHPNVATIFSVEDIDGQPFFTMEYVEGKTLDTLIPEGGLSLRVFLEWFVDLAGALSHAHEKGIVHRDIKPGNIMVTSEGVPKILDFGLAQIDPKKVAHDSSTLSMTQPGQILGTPSYMSPEQAEGEKIDNRSDIFSFGIVMYEAITGERPFKGESYAAIVSQLLTKEPPPISDIKPDTPFLLSRVIMRCLHKSASRRFQTMDEVRVILEEIKAAVEAGGEIVIGARKLASEKSGILQKRILVPLFLLIFLAAGLGIYFYTTIIPKPPISFEDLTIRKLSQTNDVVYAHITPDGKSVAYNTIEDNGERSLWIRRVEDRNALRLLPPQPVFFWGGLTISKDGSQIYYINAERNAPQGTLYRVSSLGGTPRKLVESVNDLGSLSPDGKRILYVRYGEKMQLLSANVADGSDEREILSTLSTSSTDLRQIYRDPHFSADGENIFFIKFELIKGEEYWSLVEIPATGGEERVIINARKPKINEIAVLKDGNGLLLNAVESISNLPQIFHISIADGKETRITNDLNSYFGISVDGGGDSIVTTQRSFAKDLAVFESGDPGEEKKITNEANIFETAVFTPDGKIVYDAIDNNRPHIWIMNADGSDQHQLTPNDSTDFQPLVTPDGRYIIFISERTGERKIWRMNIDGSDPQNLTPVNGRMFSHTFLPDKQSIFFHWTTPEKKAMGEVPIGGGEIREYPLFGDDYTAVSPDGKQVAFVFFDEREKRRKIRIHPFNNEEPSSVFDISPMSFLKWTADGSGLLYREIETDTESNSTIFRQSITGGKPQIFLSVEPNEVYNASQSIDGKKTVVVNGRLIANAVILTKINSH